MVASFIERNIFSKSKDGLGETTVQIAKPVWIREGRCQCKVTFSNVDKYNAYINGIDEFNAIEASLDYFHGICTNSIDPEFFWPKGESLLKRTA